MYKKELLIFVLAFSALPLRALDVSVSFCTFRSPEQNFVEVYFHFVGQTLQFQSLPDSQMQASVAVVITFKKGEEVIKFDKFNLHSPFFKRPKDFLDLRRYALENGNYNLVVSVTDIHKPEDSRQFSSPLEMYYSPGELGQSDIQLLASFRKVESNAGVLVKNGLEMEPLPFNWCHKNMSKLIFYNEIYNSDAQIGETFFISYLIRSALDQEGDPLVRLHKRIEPAAIVPLVLSMDISGIPSGNYQLEVEVRNRGKELLSKKAVFFQRSNPLLAIETDSTGASIASEQEFVAVLPPAELEYSLRAIAPLLEDEAEIVNLLIAEGNVKAQRMYLLSYWAKQSPNQPEQAYKAYMAVARAVDKMFKSGFGHGFETDRGYVYLKYGRPDDIVRVEDEPTAPPYEIWSYNSMKRTAQANVRFLFYNPSLSPGNFQLLHSNVIGERNNPQWQLDLYRDSPNDIDGGNFIDGTDIQDNMGRRAVRYFNDF